MTTAAIVRWIDRIPYNQPVRLVYAIIAGACSRQQWSLCSVVREGSPPAENNGAAGGIPPSVLTVMEESSHFLFFHSCWKERKLLNQRFALEFFFHVPPITLLDLFQFFLITVVCKQNKVQFYFYFNIRQSCQRDHPSMERPTQWSVFRAIKCIIKYEYQKVHLSILRSRSCVYWYTFWTVYISIILIYSSRSLIFSLVSCLDSDTKHLGLNIKKRFIKCQQLDTNTYFKGKHWFLFYLP